MHRAIRIDGQSRRVAVYGCTMNTLLLVNVPFAVVTVIGPLVAPSGHSGPDIGGIDEFEGCGCAVEENLACIREPLSQDLHQGAGAPVSGQVSHERRQARIEAIEDTFPELAARERTLRRACRWCAGAAYRG